MAKGPEAPEETEYQKEMAAIAKEKWQMAKDYIQPLEDMMIADVKKGITPEQRERARAAAGVSHQKQFGAAEQQARTQLAAGGVDPTSGKYQSAVSDIARGGGESLAASEVETEAGLQSAKLGSELNLLRVGSGEATQAQASMSDVARRAAVKAEHEAGLKLQEQEGLRQLAGTAIGAAAGYYGKRQTPEEFDLQHAKKFGIK